MLFRNSGPICDGSLDFFFFFLLTAPSVWFWLLRPKHDDHDNCYIPGPGDTHKHRVAVSVSPPLPLSFQDEERNGVECVAL